MSMVGLLASSQTTLRSPGLIVPLVLPPASPALFTREPCGLMQTRSCSPALLHLFTETLRAFNHAWVLALPHPALMPTTPPPDSAGPLNPIYKAQCFIHSQKVEMTLRCRLIVLRRLTWRGARVLLERVTRSAAANHRSSMAAPKAKHLRMPGAGEEAVHIMSAGRVVKRGVGGGAGKGAQTWARQERSVYNTIIARKCSHERAQTSVYGGLKAGTMVSAKGNRAVTTRRCRQRQAAHSTTVKCGMRKRAWPRKRRLEKPTEIKSGKRALVSILPQIRIK